MKYVIHCKKKTESGHKRGGKEVGIADRVMRERRGKNDVKTDEEGKKKCRNKQI